ncbi:uncharacterized protein BBA_00573 [Beauveria bassiana ARSEF 2860]|uniref:Uncharacterized protein n=1 Tax=Beauveria bassiana (strain ARSEF 2860) TaxID=655819 RepID=J5K3N1_BEAB2|nr:uncharacterized protein BBA_00573 [Beauveria bassiana ARSEF 2860]EJP70943.1 hypothetical protein BBA_00573 [Beauveria bassiana ARSEF 2860]
MAISVIARIRIHPDQTGDIPEKLARHKKIKTSLVTLADHGFSWFQRGRWGDCSYALGQFESLDEVYVDQESVENIIELGDSEWIDHHHFCIDSVMADAGVLELHRFSVKPHLRPDFERQLKDNPGMTTGGAGRLVSGWRDGPDKDTKEDPDEYHLVVFAVDAADTWLPLGNRFDPLKNIAYAIERERIGRFDISDETIKTW